MAKLLIFLAFVVLYGLYLVVTMLLLNKYLKKVSKINFLENEVLILIPNIFFFAAIFIIGRFINIQLLVIIVAGSNLGLLLTVVIWNLIGSPRSPYKEVAGWAGGDIGEKNRWMTLSASLISLVVLIAYPVVIGINYFSLDSAEAIRVMSLKYSSWLVVITYILTFPLIIGLLSSGFIDEDTRARAFLNQFGGLIAYSLFISLLFWFYNTGTAQKNFRLGDVNLVYSPELLIILVGFLFIFLVLPYFIGIQKAKRLRNDFLGSKTSLLSTVLDAIELSTEKNLVSNIESSEKEIISEYEKFISSDMGIARGLSYDKIEKTEDLPVTEQLVYQYYKIARPYDIRFNYYDFLEEMYSEMTKFKESIADDQLSKEERIILCNRYIEHFKSRETELNKRNEERGKTNPALWIGILAILSPLTSQILSEIGKYLIEVFKPT